MSPANKTIECLHRLFLKIWKNQEVPQELKDASIVTIFKKRSRRDLPAISRWEDPCESSPEPTTTSLGKYYPRKKVRFQARTRHYGHDFLCLAGAGEMQGTRAWSLLSIYRDLTKAFLDLTAAYDTVWHRGLHLKLLRIILDRHMVGFIMEMLSNRSFVVHTSDGQRSRLRRMKNGVPQGSVLSPMLFNIYISDLPETTSRKYGYADNLAILLRRPSWKEMEEGLNKDMTILVDYFRKWCLQLSIGKTVSAAYHLNNREAKRELDVFVDNKRLVFQQAPKYLGVRLDRMLNFKQHLEEMAGKVTSRVALIRRLDGTTWGASAKNTADLHTSPGIPCSWILCPCLEQKPTREEGWRRNQQLSADHIWLS